MIVSINAELGEAAVKDTILGNVLDKFWPDLETQLAGIETNAHLQGFEPVTVPTTTDAEIVRSSGYPALDAAAIDTIRSGHFKSDCDYGLGSIRIAFKLQD